jgi:hypothetical protein
LAVDDDEAAGWGWSQAVGQSRVRGRAEAAGRAGERDRERGGSMTASFGLVQRERGTTMQGSEGRRRRVGE